jgi:glycosyltransferase involved in cell wall biosynthesis
MTTAEVVVCTRNRVTRLASACEAILAQDYAPDCWHLLIVDSASTDQTYEWAQSLASRCNGRVRVVQSHEPGHSAARNTAVRSSAADIVAFTDDDALPEQGWLRTLVQAMDAEGADAGGGPVELAVSGELPPWFLTDYLAYLAIWNPADRITRLDSRNHPRGVNFAVRRRAFEQCGYFSPHLGLQGDAPLYCDETEFCLRIERTGGVVIYSPESRVQHCVEADRLTEEWLSQRFAAQGRSEAIVNWMHGGWLGLVLGTAVHVANRRTPTREQILARVVRAAAGGDGSLSPTEVTEASRILAACRRRARSAYLRQIPVSITKIPRYRPPSGSAVEPWRPPLPGARESASGKPS